MEFGQGEGEDLEIAEPNDNESNSMASSAACRITAAAGVLTEPQNGPMVALSPQQHGMV
jgi:hypothetical protein